MKVVFSKELDDAWGHYDHQYSAFERFSEAFTADWVVRGVGDAVCVWRGCGIA